MKSGVFLITAALIVLMGIYGWRCSSSRKTHEKKQHTRSQPSTDTENSGVINPSIEGSPEPFSATFSAGGESGTISISSAHAVSLYKDIHSACTVDIFFSRRAQPRDILSDPYFSFVKSFNFTSLQYSGGSTSDHDHVIVGDAKITGGKGDGYNISAADCKARGEDINSVLNGIGTVHFGKDFFNEYCALLNKLNIPGDVIANVQVGTLDELLWKIGQSHARRVILGMEQNLQSNALISADNNVYKEKISKWIQAVKQKYPDVIIVLDAAPIYRANPKFAEWNEMIKKIPGDEVRLYVWDKDAMNWQADQTQNLAAMNKLFSSTYPQWFEKLKGKFPDKKVAILQWGLKPKTDLFNTMASCIYIGKFYQFMIDYNKSNNNYIGYASFMSLKSLDRGDNYTLNHALALQACGKLFAGNKRVLDISFGNLNGVSGVACDENGRYTLLVINESGSEVNVPGITIDNSQVQGKKFTITSVSAATLGGNDVLKDTKTLNSVSLRPYSVNIIEF